MAAIPDPAVEVRVAFSELELERLMQEALNARDGPLVGAPENTERFPSLDEVREVLMPVIEAYVNQHFAAFIGEGAAYVRSTTAVVEDCRMSLSEFKAKGSKLSVRWTLQQGRNQQPITSRVPWAVWWWESPRKRQYHSAG